MQANVQLPVSQTESRFIFHGNIYLRHSVFIYVWLHKHLLLYSHRWKWNIFALQYNSIQQWRIKQFSRDLLFKNGVLYFKFYSCVFRKGFCLVCMSPCVRRLGREKYKAHAAKTGRRFLRALRSMVPLGASEQETDFEVLVSWPIKLLEEFDI